MGSDAAMTAKRIADRATRAYIGVEPHQDDPAHDSWWELHNEIARAAEDEIGRATLLCLAREKYGGGICRWCGESIDIASAGVCTARQMVAPCEKATTPADLDRVVRILDTKQREQLGD